MTETGVPDPSSILILDDDLVNRSLIRAILTRADDASIRQATLREAGSLSEARAILDREVVDLLLLDVHLPDGLGLTLAADLKRERPDRPAILALTASVLPVDQQAALDAGCDAFLAKPFPARDLITISARLLDGRRGRVTRVRSL
jgi:two-component system, OmpR family, KDP operon response regulator KdpE